MFGSGVHVYLYFASEVVIYLNPLPIWTYFSMQPEENFSCIGKGRIHEIVKQMKKSSYNAARVEKMLALASSERCLKDSLLSTC